MLNVLQFCENTSKNCHQFIHTDCQRLPTNIDPMRQVCAIQSKLFLEVYLVYNDYKTLVSNQFRALNLSELYQVKLTSSFHKTGRSINILHHHANEPHTCFLLKIVLDLCVTFIRKFQARIILTRNSIP